MFFYKQIKNGEVISYQSNILNVGAEDLIQISEDEYTEAIRRLRSDSEQTGDIKE